MFTCLPIKYAHMYMNMFYIILKLMCLLKVSVFFQKLTVTEHMEAILRFLVSTKVGGRGDGYCTISCLTEGDI